MKNKYEQFAKLIEDGIRAGKFDDSDFMPSERSFTLEYGISRVAVRMGLNLLKRRGIIESEPGKGYRIKGFKDAPPQSGLVGIVLGSPLNEIPATSIMDGMSSVLQEAGKHIIYTNCMGSLQRQKALVNSLLKRGVDGLVVVPMYKSASISEAPDSEGTFGFLKNIYDNGTPVVLVDRSFSKKGLPGVSNDDELIGYEGAKHLIREGYRKIVFLSAINKGWVAKKRFTGYMRAIQEHKLKSFVHSLDHLDLTNLNRKVVLREIDAMMNKFPDADAVQTISFLPRLIMPVIKSAGYRGNIKECIGVDWPPESREYVYPYIERPLERIGQLAAEKMIKIFNNETFTAEEFIPPEIINSRSEAFYHEKQQLALAY